MAKVIIGIHGIGNKPSPKLLLNWWKQSIRDGLKKIGRDRLFFRFEMAYWADIMHEAPLDPSIKDEGNELYIEEPYAPPVSDPEQKPKELRKKVLRFIEKQLDKIFLNDDMTVNYSFVSDIIIHHYFKELERYFSNENSTHHEIIPSVKEGVEERILGLLRKHKGCDILLISHSMGSIIAYEILTKVENEIPVDTFVTMGSPLGLPPIISKVTAEQGIIFGKKPEARTPENIVNNWYNFSDLEDKIAFNYNLGDDYKGNSAKIIAKDIIVHNDYTINGKRNHHKAYGYLRTAQLAYVIDEFLDKGRSKPIKWLLRWFNKLMAKYTHFIGDMEI